MQGVLRMLGVPGGAGVWGAKRCVRDLRIHSKLAQILGKCIVGSSSSCNETFQVG